MNILFCVPGLSSENLRLQPWLSFHRIGEVLAAQGCKVSVITDVAGCQEIPGFDIYPVKSLRGENSHEVLETISSIRPDKIVLPVTPMSLVSQGWVGKIKECDVFGYMSYPFYTLGELAKAFRYLNKNDRIAYCRHLLVPKSLWVRKLVSRFAGVICQSETTSAKLILMTAGKVNVSCVPPGIDKDVWFREKVSTTGNRPFIYVGSPYSIRGFTVLLKALERVNEAGMCCRILARGADGKTLERIKTDIAARPISVNVEVCGGWVDIHELRQEISNASAVVVPFVLVPSELPVSVMEAIACGTPVIGTDIDGLPSTIGDAGILVPHADAASLASAMDRLWRDKSLQKELSGKSELRSKEFKPWEEVATLWAEVLETG